MHLSLTWKQKFRKSGVYCKAPLEFLCVDFCTLPTTTRLRLSSCEPICGWTGNDLIFSPEPIHKVVFGGIILSNDAKTWWLEDLRNNFLKGFSNYLASRHCYSLLNRFGYLSFHALEDILILILLFHHHPVRQNLLRYLMVWRLFTFLGQANQYFLTWCFMTFPFFM